MSLGDDVVAYDITGGEPGTLIQDAAKLTTVQEILVVYEKAGPTCEGGEIEKVDGTWVVTPNKNVAAVTIGNLLDNGEPFTVGEGGVTVTVKAIPGLKYTLWRAGTLSAPRGEDAAGTVWDAVGEPVVATGTSVTLTDDDPPEDKAFYVITVAEKS